MNQKLIIVAALCLATKFACAQSADSSVTIGAAKDQYAFIYNPGAQAVQVKQKQLITYVANNFQANIPVSELYNDQLTIDNVTCKVDGRTPKDFKPLTGYYGGEDIFFSDEKICYFPLTITKKGSSAAVTFDKTVADPRYFTRIDFSEPYAITHKEISVKIPRWMKVELKEYNFNNLDIKKTTQYNSAEDADIITYLIENLPAIVKETHSPGPTYLYPHLLVMCKSAQPANQNFTYFNTLDDQYHWYHGLVSASGNDAVEVSAKAKELTAGITSNLAKIKAIFYYVQDNIRYIAFEDGIAGFKPESAAEVLRKKYGDCKGMANLTKSLLTAAGFDAHLCWLGTNHIAYDYQTPSLAVDNHMICALNYEGKTYFLDATESYLGFNEYAERIQGRQVLVDNGDKYLLSRIPLAAEGQNLHRETGKFKINSGAFTGSVNHLWKGEDKEELLTGLNSVKKENTQTAMISYLSDDNPDYAVTGLALSGITDPNQDAGANYSVNYKSGLSAFGNDYYVDLDRSKDFREAAFKLEERKLDYWFPHKFNFQLENELMLPPGYKATNLPKALDVVNPDYEFHVNYSVQADKLVYKKSIRIKNTHLPRAAFARWNADINLLAQAYNETVTLKPITQ